MAMLKKRPSSLLNTDNPIICVQHEAIRSYRRDNPQASVKAVASWARSNLKLKIDVSDVYQILIEGNNDHHERPNARQDFSKTWPMSHDQSGITQISKPYLSKALSSITVETVL